MKGDEKLAFSNANDTIYYSNEAFVFFFCWNGPTDPTAIGITTSRTGEMRRSSLRAVTGGWGKGSHCD